MNRKRIRLLFGVLLLWTGVLQTTFAASAADKWPDGTTIPSWFADTTRVDPSSLGRRYVVTRHGVCRDSTLIQTSQLQAVIDLAAREGGGVVVIPRGVFLSGSLFFRPGTHLQLERGARLKGVDDIRHYPLLDSRMEGQSLKYFAALVNGEGLDSFTITGPGTIDGNGLRFWEEFWIRRRFNPDCTNLEALRPRLVFLSNCSNVHVQDVHLINSGFWTNHLYRCHHVKYLGCTIYAPHEPADSKAPSSDALDLDVCHDVLVHGCRISVNDDAVVIKGGKGTWADKDPRNGPSYNIIIQQCKYGFVHGCLTLGSESLHDWNIILRDCQVDQASRVLWLKMRPDTPQHYERLVVERLTGNCGSFLSVRPWTQFYKPEHRADMPLSQCHDITIRDIDMRCRRFFDVGTSDKYRLHHFRFEDLRIREPHPSFEPSLIDSCEVHRCTFNGHPFLPGPPVTSTAKAGTRWWWLGSAVDEANLRWSQQEYASHGLGAVEITPIYGVQGNGQNNIPFLSPQWMKMLRLCEEEGRRQGIQVDMNCGTGWPFGGPEVPLSEAACKVVVVDTVVSASRLPALRLQAPPRERDRARLLVQRDYPTSVRGQRRVIALFQSRTLQRVKRAAPGGEGWVIDHFDSLAVAHYLQRFDSAFAASGTPWPATFFNDSYEVYGADWTPTLLAEFARRRGYRLEDHLPEFVDGNPRVIADYRETLSDLLLKNFTEQWAAWAHSHGVQVRNQAHGSPANLIDIYAAVDIPEIEGFGLTDFGIKGLRTDAGNTRRNDSDLSMLKYAPSAAHITGKPLASSETFTWLTEHFRTSLSQMKPDLDLMFCAGVNRVFFHGTCYSPQSAPWPGWHFYASVDMSPTNTIWRDAPGLLSYIERCQRYLQWGQPDNDFLVLLPVRDMWQRDTRHRLMQFDIHSMAHRAPEFIRAILTIDSLGFDCDYISERYLLSTTYAGGCLRTAAGTTYRALVLPDDYLVSNALQQHLDSLRAQGAPIVRGLSATELSRYAQSEALKSRFRLKMIRRRNPLGYHYFIVNLTPEDLHQSVPLARECSDACWYDPLTGERYAARFSENGLDVVLRSGQSLILQTFDAPQGGCRQLPERPYMMGHTYGRDGQHVRTCSEIRLDELPWTLRFDSTCVPRPASVYQLERIGTWERLDDTTQQLMGTGIYECAFEIPTEKASCSECVLDLGDVRESARVWLNGYDLGCCWAVPFVLAVPTSCLRAGINNLRIEVTNLPANRIAELDRQQVPWRRFEEINMVNLQYKKSSYAGWQPVPSGLIGPIRLMFCASN